MNSFWLAVTVGIIALCCSQLVCADIKTINEYLDAKVEPIYDDNLEKSISALRELRAKKSKAIHTRLIGSGTGDLIDEMLEAASWIEQKNCSDIARFHQFDSDFDDDGSARRLLFKILDKKDIVCARELLAREQLRYNSLDSTQTSKVERIGQITLEALGNGVLSDGKKYDGSALAWRVANEHKFSKDLFSWNFLDGLLGYLEAESHKDRCQFLGQEVKALTEQHISSPCDYYNRETKDIYLEHQKSFVRNVEFTEGLSRRLDSLELSDYQEFNRHLVGYQVCSFLNGDEKSVFIQDLAEQLKVQCLKRMYN